MLTMVNFFAKSINHPSNVNHGQFFWQNQSIIHQMLTMVNFFAKSINHPSNVNHGQFFWQNQSIIHQMLTMLDHEFGLWVWDGRSVI
jgi:hypothetical protein